VVLGMVAWTAYVVWAYAGPARRTPPLLVADLAVAVAALAVTPVVKGEHFNATVPGFWVAGAMLAWAVHWRWPGGLAAGLVVCAADVLSRDEVTQGNYGNLFLLAIGGAIVGFLSESLHRMAVERDAAQREAIVAEERTRLARAVHDGVLQVLALVQRRGRDLGPEAAELGRLAGEQEQALRALIREQDATAAPDSAAEADLVGALSRLERSTRVSLAAPADEVLLPSALATELVAAVAACLDNVCAHVGDDAPAWVLVEALPDRVVVSVRDEGPGIPEGRLAEAAAEGRLGVASSICGRMAEVGGSAVLTSGPSGTEWELSVPR
jgi:signal transduction histidine kinase